MVFDGFCRFLMVFIVLGCIVGGIVGQLGCSPCYGAVGTPPPHNLAHGHPLRMAVPFVCVCVCVCVCACVRTPPKY